MNKYYLIILMVGLSFFMSCHKENITTSTTDSDTGSTNNTVDAVGNLVNHEAASDYVWDTSTVVHIQLNVTSITVDKAGATVNGNTVTITAAGTYKISGSLTNGQILVNASDTGVVRLIFNGITVGNTSTAPVFVKNATKAVIILADNTVSTISDATTYVYSSSTDDEPNAAIFSKENLTIYGNGTLKVTGNYNDAIASKDGLIIRNATISVTSVDDGIRGKDYLVVNQGNITVNVKGDGLKSDNDTNTAAGYILLLDGTFNIIAARDGITAQTDVSITKGVFSINTGGGSSVTRNTSISTKGIKGLASVVIEDGTFVINSSDDGIHTNNDITIKGGTFTISSGDDGLHGDATVLVDGGDITISKSYEGIESASITINSGNVSVTSSDDGFNATKGLVNGGTESSDGSCLYIHGGNIFVNSSGGDGLDSNGSIVITGGTTIVNGPASQPEVGMDYNGTCNISGGFLIVSGISSSMAQGASSSSTQYSLKLLMTSSLAASKLFHIQDSSGNDVVTFQPLRNCSAIVFSSSLLKNGATYSIYTGGSSTGTLTHGIYEGGIYTGGTLYSSFTISSIVTSIGSSNGH